MPREKVGGSIPLSSTEHGEHAAQRPRRRPNTGEQRGHSPFFHHLLLCRAVCIGGSRALAVGLAHLEFMDTKEPNPKFADRSQATLIEQVLSLSELCAHLHFRAQTIYDLRSQGRGPRGFRVGRELRFRVSEVEACLARMEQDDGHRHVSGRA